MKRWIKDQKGVSAIEFAIILPVLVVLIFGMIEFSVLLYDKAMLTNASREGARAGIVYSDPRPSDGEIQTVVNNYCQDHLITFGAGSTVSTTVARAGSGSGGEEVAGDPLTVTVTYQYDFLVLPNLITSLTGGINLNATTVMRME
jgi:Flp pilus assembly protein TadG